MSIFSNIFKPLFLKTEKDDVELANQELFKPYDNGYKAWDPTGVSPDISRLKYINAENYAKYLHLQKDPKKLMRQFVIVSIICIILSIILHPFIFIFIFAFYALWKSFYRDLIKVEIAQENNWLYNPNEDYNLWLRYKNKFPQIFDKGNRNQNIEDVFWGAVKTGNNWNYFVSGIFNYTVHSGSGKNSSNHHYVNNFFAIKLPKKLTSEFLLYPENAFSKIGNFFTKKEINTESIEFNNTFAFSYNGNKDDKALGIVKTLSPRVQEELLKFNSQKKGGLSVYFVEDIVIFYSTGLIIKKMKTDFIFKSIRIAQEDKDYMTNELKTSIDIATEIVKYLD